MCADDKASLVPVHTSELSTSVDTFQKGLSTYLNTLSLPSDNILVDLRERRQVLNNLPSVMDMLPVESRIRSYYVAKFVAACAAGLFDAALNFVWDETVISLREKVVQFDLEYFYNSVITDPERRRKFNDANEITKLDDWELIRGCHLTGILSEIGFKHLDYIRDMRNWASAAHPNQNQLSGLQLVSWLETCIREVIGKAPSAPAIEVKRLLHNIRTHVLSQGDVEQVKESILLLPQDLATSLLRTVFGMFCDPVVSVSIKSNIRLIANAIWSRAPEQTKCELGIKYATFGANADIPRRDAARDFLQTVNGLTYLPKDTLALEMNESINVLFMAHTGFNNFHNEPPHAKTLARFVPANGQIPDAVRYTYVKTVTMCYIGNGYGVSIDAYAYYEGLVAKYQDMELYVLLTLMEDEDFLSRLQFPDCRKRYRELLLQLSNKTTNEVIVAGIAYLLRATDAQLPVCGKTTEFKRITGRL